MHQSKHNSLFFVFVCLFFFSSSSSFFFKLVFLCLFSRMFVRVCVCDVIERWAGEKTKSQEQQRLRDIRCSCCFSTGWYICVFPLLFFFRLSCLLCLFLFFWLNKFNEMEIMYFTTIRENMQEQRNTHRSLKKEILVIWLREWHILFRSSRL